MAMVIPSTTGRPVVGCVGRSDCGSAGGDGVGISVDGRDGSGGDGGGGDVERHGVIK